MTNYEMIKNMSMGEMAVSLMCPAYIDCTFDKEKRCKMKSCVKCTFEWLKEDVTESDCE